MSVWIFSPSHQPGARKSTGYKAFWNFVGVGEKRFALRGGQHPTEDGFTARYPVRVTCDFCAANTWAQVKALAAIPIKMMK
jgi:hypothetical protein